MPPGAFWGAGQKRDASHVSSLHQSMEETHCPLQQATRELLAVKPRVGPKSRCVEARIRRRRNPALPHPSVSCRWPRRPLSDSACFRGSYVGFRGNGEPLTGCGQRVYSNVASCPAFLAGARTNPPRRAVEAARRAAEGPQATGSLALVQVCQEEEE
jgi:hypothetical protein